MSRYSARCFFWRVTAPGVLGKVVRSKQRHITGQERSCRAACIPARLVVFLKGRSSRRTGGRSSSYSEFLRCRVTISNAHLKTQDYGRYPAVRLASSWASHAAFLRSEFTPCHQQRPVGDTSQIVCGSVGVHSYSAHTINCRHTGYGRPPLPLFRKIFASIVSRTPVVFIMLLSSRHPVSQS